MRFLFGWRFCDVLEVVFLYARPPTPPGLSDIANRGAILVQALAIAANATRPQFPRRPKRRFRRGKDRRHRRRESHAHTAQKWSGKSWRHSDYRHRPGRRRRRRDDGAKLVAYHQPARCRDLNALIAYCARSAVPTRRSKPGEDHVFIASRQDTDRTGLSLPAGQHNRGLSRFSSAARRKVAALEQARGPVAEHEPQKRRHPMVKSGCRNRHEKRHQRAERERS